MVFKKGNLIKILPSIFNSVENGKIIFIKEKASFLNPYLFFDLNDFKLKTGTIYKFEILK